MYAIILGLNTIFFLSALVILDKKNCENRSIGIVVICVLVLNGFLFLAETGIVILNNG